jgi:hypothetical protein
MNWVDDITLEGHNIIYETFTKIVKNLHYFYLPSDFQNHQYSKNCKLINNSFPMIEMNIIDMEVPEYQKEWIGEAIDTLQNDLINELNYLNIKANVYVNNPTVEIYNNISVMSFNVIFTVYNIIDIVGEENYNKSDIFNITYALNNVL